jgi:hypothetical protein
LRTTLALCATALAAAANASIVGQWEFDGNLDAAIGSNLTANGTIAFESATIDGSTAQVAHLIPPSTFTTGLADPFLTVTNPIGGNGGGSFSNQYSIVMDVFYAASSYRTNGDFTSLYQTAPGDTNDGDWFVRGDGGMGISGDYTDLGNSLVFGFGQWHRVALTIDTTSASGSATYRSYIDGVQQNQVQSPSGWSVDGRYSLGSTFLLFADEDGEINEPFINSLQLRDTAMSANEVAALGGASAAGIPVPEPASIAVIGLGIAALIKKRRAI